MVSRQSVISEYFKGTTRFGSGSVRHKGESQTPSLYDSIPRQGSDGGGRVVTGLESVPENISVSSSESSFEGFGPSETLQGESGLNSPLLADQLVVHDAATEWPNQVCDPGETRWGIDISG